MRKYFKVMLIFKIIVYKFVYGNKLKCHLRSFLYKNCVIEIEGEKAQIILGKSFNGKRNVKIRAVDNGEIYIGDNVYLNDNSIIVSRGKIYIGNDCLIGPNVCFYDHNHKFKSKILIREQGFSVGEIRIGDNVWIGSNCTILKDVTIGSNSIIAAGTVISKDIPSNCIVYNSNNSIIINPIIFD